MPMGKKIGGGGGGGERKTRSNSFQNSFYSDLNNHYPTKLNSHEAGYGEI